MSAATLPFGALRFTPREIEMTYYEEFIHNAYDWSIFGSDGLFDLPSIREIIALVLRRDG